MLQFFFVVDKLLFFPNIGACVLCSHSEIHEILISVNSLNIC